MCICHTAEEYSILLNRKQEKQRTWMKLVRYINWKLLSHAKERQKKWNVCVMNTDKRTEQKRVLLLGRKLWIDHVNLTYYQNTIMPPPDWQSSLNQPPIRVTCVFCLETKIKSTASELTAGKPQLFHAYMSWVSSTEQVCACHRHTPSESPLNLISGPCDYPLGREGWQSREREARWTLQSSWLGVCSLNPTGTRS